MHVVQRRVAVDDLQGLADLHTADVRDVDAALLVDLWSDGNSDPEYFETVISFVATTCVELSRDTNEAQVDFRLASDQNESVSGKASNELWRRALDALAKCQPDSNADLDWLVEQSRTIQEQNLRPIVLTTRPADELAAADFGDAIIVPFSKSMLQVSFRLIGSSLSGDDPQLQAVEGTA